VKNKKILAYIHASISSLKLALFPKRNFIAWMWTLNRGARKLCITWNTSDTCCNLSGFCLICWPIGSIITLWVQMHSVKLIWGIFSSYQIGRMMCGRISDNMTEEAIWNTLCPVTYKSQAVQSSSTAPGCIQNVPDLNLEQDISCYDHFCHSKHVFSAHMRFDNNVRPVATVCLSWQQWIETSVWFDKVGIWAFHSCIVVDLWQSLSEWHLLLSECVLVCCHNNVGAWIRATNEH
jgi:hypothetical protein